MAQSRLVSLEASVKPLQRDILLSQKQRAFSKAVVLVAPEKRLLVVVLTAAVSSRLFGLAATK